MVKTFGLTHLALGVENVEHSFAFCEAVFGMDRDGYLLEIWYEIPTAADPT